MPFFLAGGAALVQGRGERVAPLPGVRSELGVLLVTPGLEISTRDVFEAFDAGARSPNPGATRTTSAHLAEELARGSLDAVALAARAGVLATANDLTTAAEAVAPGLTAFRRALARRLGRPVGQSGSGPTCWALYASLAAAETAAADVRAAVTASELPTPSDGPPQVIATTITRARRDQEDTSHDP